MNKKEKIKNAAIIFLAVMLILTLFSNTILNWSLPEVAVQYPSYQQVSQQITGSGTVEAADTYQIKTGSAKLITGVFVKQNDIVVKDQLLFSLESGDSDELTAAKNELRNAEDEYNKLLLVNGDDYTLDELNIKNKEDEYNDALKKQENFAENTALYEKAKQARIDAEEKVTELKNQLSEVNAENKYGVYVYLPANYSKLLKDASDKIEKLNNELEDGKAALEDLNAELPSADADFISLRENVAKYENLLANLRWQYANLDSSGLDSDGNIDPDLVTAAAAKSAQLLSDINDAQANLATAEAKYNQALTNSSAASILKTRINGQAQTNKNTAKRIETATEEQVALKAKISKEINLKIAEATILVTDLTADEAEAKTAVGGTKAEVDKSVRDLEYSLAELKASLQQKKENAAVESGKSAIDIATKKEQLDELKAKVEKLTTESDEGSQILAPVAGVVTTVNLVSGNTTEAGGVAAEIAVSASGYIVSFSVSNEQARRVSPGQQAEIQSWYRDENMTATLSSIKTDETDPSNKKKLVFKITGEITPGMMLTLQLGQQAQGYQSVIPNSAIREDNNGKFVLMLQAKNSPLGSRYTAVRADITVIATDGKVSAVSGIDDMLAVITTSSLPLTPGMQVRLANNS